MLATVSRQSKVFGRRYASALAQKYSHALYSAALKKSPQQLVKVQAELSAISNIIKTNEDVAAFISNPTLTAQDRSNGLQAVFTAASKKEQISDLTKNLFAVLSENGRLGETKGVIEGFEQLVAKHKGELEVIVTSAQPLPADVQRRLETSLKQSQAAQQAKTLKITNKVSWVFLSLRPIHEFQVNPSVIGGLVVDFGDKTLDLSVSSRVNKLNTMLHGKDLVHCADILIVTLPLQRLSNLMDEWQVQYNRA
jgi:F-type H+-transporting ATPase subunit O